MHARVHYSAVGLIGPTLPALRENVGVSFERLGAASASAVIFFPVHSVVAEHQDTPWFEEGHYLRKENLEVFHVGEDTYRDTGVVGRWFVAELIKRDVEVAHMQGVVDIRLRFLDEVEGFL